MTWWIDVPLGHPAESEAPTWGSLAERFERCSGRAAFYVARRVDDRSTFERILARTLESNLDLLVGEHDELEELRRLRATADRLIATSHIEDPGPRGSRS
jgi:hypothetical protein